MARLPESVGDAFRRLLAPRPRVLVFVDLPGWQYAATEVPKTFQVIVGVSIGLFRQLEAQHFDETGRRLSENVDVQHVGGPFHIIPVIGGHVEFVSPDGPGHHSPEVADLKIAPQPVDVAEVRPIDR